MTKELLDEMETLKETAESTPSEEENTQVTATESELALEVSNEKLDTHVEESEFSEPELQSEEEEILPYEDEVEIIENLEEEAPEIATLSKNEARRRARNQRIKKERERDLRIRNKRSGVQETRDSIPDLPNASLDIVPPRASNVQLRGFGTNSFKPKNTMFRGGNGKISINAKDRFEKEETPEERLKKRFLASLDPNIRTIFTGHVIGYRPLKDKNTGKSVYFVMVNCEGRVVLIRLADFTAPQGGSFSIEVNESTSEDDAIKKYINGRRNSVVDFVIKYMDQEDLDGGWVIGSRSEAMEFYRNKYWFGKTYDKDSNGNNLDFIREGKEVEARVVTVLRTGILVEIFGLEVFIPNKDLFHSHVADTTKEFKTGQKISVKVLSVDRKGSKISCRLSHKDTKEDPTAMYLRQYGVADRVSGRVTHIEFVKDPSDVLKTKTIIFVNVEGKFDIYCRMRAGVKHLPIKGQEVSVLLMGKSEDGTRAWGEITHIYELDL